MSHLCMWCESKVPGGVDMWKTGDLTSWLSWGEVNDREAKQLADQEKSELTDQVTGNCYLEMERLEGSVGDKE